MEDHDQRARALEREADELEHKSERVEEDIDEARSDWESKQDAADVPGAVSEEREESDQLPEEERGTGNPPDERQDE